jgi:hypothetical protein
MQRSSDGVNIANDTTTVNANSIARDNEIGISTGNIQAQLNAVQASTGTSTSTQFLVSPSTGIIAGVLAPNIIASSVAVNSIYQGALQANTSNAVYNIVVASAAFSYNCGMTKRVITTTDNSTATINVAITDVYELSAIAYATTISTSGVATNGQTLMIRLKDAGVAKALTWSGFTAIGVTLPTTTVAGKWHYIGCVYNTVAGQWHALAVGVQP